MRGLWVCGGWLRFPGYGCIFRKKEVREWRACGMVSGSFCGSMGIKKPPRLRGEAGLVRYKPSCQAAADWKASVETSEIVFRTCEAIW